MPLEWLPLVFILSWLAILLLVVGILLIAFKRRPQRRGWAPQQQQHVSAQPAGPGSLPFAGEWNAAVVPEGSGLLSVRRDYGIIRLESGLLSFTPDGAAAPVWTVPCNQLVADRQSYFSLDGGDVQLSGPMGVVRCAVSTEHINRFSTNTAKDLRERRYAAQFVGLLHAHGARPSAVADPYR